MNTYQRFLNMSHKTRKISDFRELVYGSAEQFGDYTAFKLRSRNVTYNIFKEDYAGLCKALIQRGYRNSKIAIIGANSYGWILAYLAASTIGISVPIDKELSGEDIYNFIKAAGCNLVLGDEASLKKIQAATSEQMDYYSIDTVDLEFRKSVFDLVWEGCNIYTYESENFDSMDLKPDEMHVLLFTSGTTGNSKGVCLSQTNICSNIMSIASMVRVDNTRHALSVLPLHHTYESTIGHLLILAGGGCISYADGLRHVGKNMMEYSPSVIVAVPLLLEHMLRTIEKAVRNGLPDKYAANTEISLLELLQKLPIWMRFMVVRKVKHSLGGKLKLLIVGAAPVKPETIETFEALGITTYQGYGLTETSPLLAGNNDFYMCKDAVGLPIHGVEIKIDNADESGVGEIIARGSNIMLGYYNDEEETEKVLKDGWFRTGDLGRFDEEGFLYITGRLKNVIITRNGKNIYPEELEKRLLDEELIEEVIVVAAENLKKDDVTAKARIFPSFDVLKELYKDGMPSDEIIARDIKAIVEKINDKMPTYKRISLVEIVKEPFEKTTTKKIKRFGTNVV